MKIKNRSLVLHKLIIICMMKCNAPVKNQGKEINSQDKLLSGKIGFQKSLRCTLSMHT